MELEEMKRLWADMSEQLEQQKKLTNDIIMNMTQQRYSRKFETLFTFEAIGAVLCYVFVFILLLNFYKLDSWYYALCGIFVGAFFVIFPSLVLRSLNKLRKLKLSEYSYHETVISFMKEKKQLLYIQKVGMYFYFPLMITVLLTAVKIMRNKNFFLMEKSISLYIALAVIFGIALWIASWGYNHYKKVTAAAENVLKELE